MEVRDVIQAKKVVTSQGAWHTGTKMPKTAFPLAKSNSFRVSARYTWRLVTFTCLGENFRVLIYYRLDLEKYDALLGMDVGGDMLCLARFEYHATEPGWHMHTDCGSGAVVSGRHGGFSVRVPGSKQRHRRIDFGVTGEDSAWKIAVDAFGLDKVASELLLGH